MIPTFICLFVTQTGCAKTAERIDVLFGVETSGDPISIVGPLDGVPYPTARREVRCGLRQITLATCPCSCNSVFFIFYQLPKVLILT